MQTALSGGRTDTRPLATPDIRNSLEDDALVKLTA
jgi:hypothetical protein